MKALRELTVEDVYKMEAGREMDILVAEVILDQDRMTCRVDPMSRNGEPQFYYGYPAGHDFAFDYSTQATAAVTILDFVKSTWSLERYREEEGLFYQCNLRIGISIGVIYNCKTKELALCKALLIAAIGKRDHAQPI